MKKAGSCKSRKTYGNVCVAGFPARKELQVCVCVGVGEEGPLPSFVLGGRKELNQKKV